MRYRDDGSCDPGFLLDKPLTLMRKILIACDNFGCGSSREHAPWAMLDFGIRCVISTDSADIFDNNCFKNGIRRSRWRGRRCQTDGRRRARPECDAEHRLGCEEICGPDGGTVKFELDPFRKARLLEGLDDIGLTLVEALAIAGYEAKAKSADPWL